jgi:methionine-rich copper-binding protein CopC
MKMTYRTVALLVAMASSALMVASGAQAHAHLVKADPAENAAVAAPRTIHLEFSEKLEPNSSAVTLMKANGAAVTVTSKADGMAIDGTIDAPLPPGGYMVMWRALSADGHKVTGQYDFTVR